MYVNISKYPNVGFKKQCFRVFIDFQKVNYWIVFNTMLLFYCGYLLFYLLFFLSIHIDI